MNHLGGRLAYSFGRDEDIVVGSEVEDGNIVVFCFGEIDCRCHVHKYQPNWKESINNLVTSYVVNVKKNIIGKSIVACIFNVVPPLEREDPKNHAAELGSGTPAEGSDKDRQKYTVYMNERLKKACEDYELTYFDVYDKYTNEKGFINEELSDGNCHISNPIYMEQFIADNLMRGKKYGNRG
tara:strand:- start:3444 stop:3989 length:546 start_codon:yes stop_codon:yes gene_type:complete